MIPAQELKELFRCLSVSQIKGLGDDITALVTQLQALLDQKDTVDLSRALIAILTDKVHNYIAPLRTAYIDFVTKEYNVKDLESVKTKNLILSEFRKTANPSRQVSGQSYLV